MNPNTSNETPQASSPELEPTAAPTAESSFTPSFEPAPEPIATPEITTNSEPVVPMQSVESAFTAEPSPEVPASQTAPEIEQPSPVEAVESVLTSEPAQVPVAPESAPEFPMTAAETAPQAADPGSSMGIASLVLSLIGFGLLGWIFGAIARKKSRAAGHKNTVALIGMVIGIITTILGVVVVGLLAVVISIGAIQRSQFCLENGAGTHSYTKGGTIVCSTENSVTDYNLGSLQ